MELTAPKRFKKDYIVITGFIFANEPVTKQNRIFVGVTADANHLKLEDLILQNALVYIIDLETDEKYYFTFYHNIPENQIIEDPLIIGFYDPLELFIPEHGKTYRIVVLYENEIVYAETTVPSNFTVIQNNYFVSDEYLVIPSISVDKIDDIVLEIKVSNIDKHILIIEYFCLEEWNNAYWINQNEYNKPINKLDYENIISGYPRRKRVLETFLPNEVNEEHIISLTLNKSNFLFYGKYKVSLLIINENYYNYQNTNMGMFNGGIVNGIGYFDSASRQVFFTNISPN